MRRIFCIVLTASCLLFVTELVSYAFCVYNKTDAEIVATESKGGRGLSRFKATIEPGERSCCNWKNRDCNKEGKKDSIVEFEVEYIIHLGQDNVTFKTICKDFPIKAGGWLEVVGKDRQYQCKAYY